jgi:hypothetical protein
MFDAYLGMARPALRIEVSAKDQKELGKLVSGGVQQVRVVLRALALLQLVKGVSVPRIAGIIPLRRKVFAMSAVVTSRAVCRGRFMRDSGLEPRECWKIARTMFDCHGMQQPAGRPHPLDGPPGCRGSRQTQARSPRGKGNIWILLLSHDLKPWREKM